MAYDYLGLVNDINHRLNEVPLTSVTFANATGFYLQAKEAVNASMRYINQAEYQWPFNHVRQEDVLSENVSRYAFPLDCKLINFNTFRIKEDSTLGNSTSRLNIMQYEDYLDNFVEQEYNSDKYKGLPRHVVHTPSLEYILTPKPDKAYTLVYEYYRVPVDLINATDVPIIPENFRHIIIDGAMYYAYMFRGNTQDAQLSKQKFDEGIKHMTSILINRFSYVRSTLIPQNTGGGNRLGNARSTAGAAFD